MTARDREAREHADKTEAVHGRKLDHLATRVDPRARARRARALVDIGSFVSWHPDALPLARTLQPRTAMGERPRRLAIGAEITPDHRSVSFRVWAPAAKRLAVVIESPSPRELALRAEPGGYFAGTVQDLGAGARYRLRADDRAALLSDPASRYQPEGPFGPSEVVDPDAFRWTDAAWRGIARDDHVLYELHVGTFTPEGTWAAAAAALPYLAEVGITTLDIMPINEFNGARGWGYDGVNFYAPSHLYGTPDDVRAFVDRAHALGLAVILDVVYNHVGPSGNMMFELAPGYRLAAKQSEWGATLDFSMPDVRAYFVANAGYWIDEFHMDGLRLDATNAIVDTPHGRPHVLREIATRARAAGRGRQIFIVGENEPQDVRLITEHGLDAVWSDDFHHTARIALTGVIDGYLIDYRGTPQELISAVARGYLFQGQLYRWHQRPRGSPVRDLRPRGSCITSRITIRSRTSVAASASHSSATPRRCAR